MGVVYDHLLLCCGILMSWWLGLAVLETCLPRLTEDRTGTFRVAELYPLLQDFNLQVNPNAGFIRLLDVKLPFFVYLVQSSGILCFTQIFTFV